MPIVAVVAAVAIDAGAAAAFAGGLAITSTLGALTAVTAIGATMGAIGAVTGNKTLSMIGMGLGIVGGIGTLATSAGWFGDAAAHGADSIFGSSSAGGAVGDTIATDAAAEAAYQPGAVTAEGLPGAAGTGTAVSSVGDIAASNPAGLINSSLSGAQGSAAAIAGGELSGSGSATLTGSSVNAFAPSVTGTLPDGAVLTDPWSDAINAAGKANFGAGAPTGFAAFAKNNQLLSYGIIQAGGSFISGLTNPMTPAQINALDSQANANNAAAALAQRQAANMSGGLPTATVTGRPASTTGLINNNPTKAPLITGAPNTAPPATQPVTGTV